LLIYNCYSGILPMGWNTGLAKQCTIPNILKFVLEKSWVGIVSYSWRQTIQGLPNGPYVGVLTDRIISDFIRDPIRKIIKIIWFVSVSGDIHIWNSFTDADMVRPLPIRIRPFSFYSSISDIIRRYPIRFYPNMYPKYFYYIFFN
jgi:hypothetical protein